MRLTKDEKMKSIKPTWPVAIAIGLYATSATSATAVPNETSEIIDGIVARARALYTIKVQYSYHGEIVQDGRSLQSEDRQLTFALEGNDWLLRTDDSPNFRMSRHRECFRYYEATADRHPHVDRSLHIGGSQELEDLIHEHASHAVVRLGTFWFEPQAKFVDQHRSECVDRGTTVVEGERTHVLEWPVKAKQFDEAMIVIPRPIAVARSGVLRVYASERLNWALPRVEYCTAKGQVKRRFSASQFESIADGVYFPNLASSQRFMGDRTQKSDFHVKSIQHANEPIPTSEFTLRAGVGTRVRDSRPGMAATVFHLQQPEDVSQLEKDLLAPSDATTVIPRHRVLLLLGNLVMLLVLFAAWGVRRWRA